MIIVDNDAKHVYAVRFAIAGDPDPVFEIPWTSSPPLVPAVGALVVLPGGVTHNKVGLIETVYRYHRPRNEVEALIIVHLEHHRQPRQGGR